MLAGCDKWISIQHVDNTYSKIDGNFGNVSAGVLFSKDAYQRSVRTIRVSVFSTNRLVRFFDCHDAKLAQAFIKRLFYQKE